MPGGLLGIEPLDRVEIEGILDRAKRFQPRQTDTKKSDQLRGRMIVNLFFEASTRTRTSFEIAAKRLGADAISITASASSVSKGESLVDTLNTLGAMHPDAIVMRHAASGAPHFLARYLAHAHHQRRRRHARASHSGAARRPHHSGSPAHARRPARRHHRRHRAQPCGALQHVPAIEIRRANRPVRTRVSAAAGIGRSLRPASA